MVNQTGFWRWLKDNIAEVIEEFTDGLKENWDIVLFIAGIVVPPILITIGSLVLATPLSPFYLSPFCLLLFLLFIPWGLGLAYFIWWDENRMEA